MKKMILAISACILFYGNAFAAPTSENIESIRVKLSEFSKRGWTTDKLLYELKNWFGWNFIGRYNQSTDGTEIIIYSTDEKGEIYYFLSLGEFYESGDLKRLN